MNKPKKKVTRTIRVYKSYNFVAKDPIIDELRTAVADSGASYEDIQADSGVTVQTLKSWFHGGTRRPQFATVKAVARVIGHDLVLQPTNVAKVTEGILRQNRRSKTIIKTS